MKKLIAALILVFLIAAMVSCGPGNSDSGSANSGGEDSSKIERNIDATAQALGLSAGEETYYQMIGANEGREYNDGAIELYRFDENSEEYKEIENSGEVAGTEVAAYKDGIVMIFVGIEQDQEIIDSFNELEYK